MNLKFLILALIAIMINSCDNNNENSSSIEEGVSITSVVQANFKTSNDVIVSVSGSTISINSTGLPDHKTPYWDIENQTHPLYEPFPTFLITSDIYDDFPQLPDLIGQDSNGNTTITYKNNVNTQMTVMDYTMQIPTNPVEATNKQATDLGVIGLALNGVPIYNNYEGPQVLSAGTMTTFDAAGAHPGPQTDYHYHASAQLGIYSTNDGSLYPTVNDSKLIGFLRDGFPIYGRQDSDGSYPADLDEEGGHFGVTPEFSNGIYHYHCSNENYLGSGWYIMKSGNYHGTPGSVF